MVLILRLMEAGHTAAQADAACGVLPAWHGADRAEVASFSAANARLWKSISVQDPEPWKLHMARMAEQWCSYWSGMD
ncbi:hypothetical protein [Streptomyces sp. NBC_01727]|uniref:hypothetical protein n=1 Tax=Streptomyces sp. NBC_01727 TaxID=2975924 RepID=UPI002E12FB49|nr:hypothetical protein OIE76_01565 [Streptomyces sp. NBC_01727]